MLEIIFGPSQIERDCIWREQDTLATTKLAVVLSWRQNCWLTIQP